MGYPVCSVDGWISQKHERAAKSVWTSRMKWIGAELLDGYLHTILETALAVVCSVAAHAFAALSAVA